MTASEWNHLYTREEAAYPLPFIKDNKFWPSIGRINNVYGDKNLVCTCGTVEDYTEWYLWYQNFIEIYDIHIYLYN